METTVDAPLEPQPVQQVFQIATGFMGSAALQTALKLPIPDRVVARTRAANELARDARVDRTLCTGSCVRLPVSAFSTSGSRAPSTSRSSAADSRRVSPASTPWVYGTSPFHFRAYAETLFSVITGTPAAERVAGMPVFEYLAKPENKELSEITMR